MKCKWILPSSREWNLGHLGPTGGSLKGPQNLSVAVGLVSLGRLLLLHLLLAAAHS